MMIDNEDLKFNFGCASCGYKEVKRRIPVSRIISKLDELLSKNEMEEVTRLLDNWRKEAVQIGDLSGELSIVNEQLGHFRKVQNREAGLESVERSIELVKLLGIENEVSGATILLNAATTLKAFGEPEKALPIYDKTYSVYSAKLDKNDTRFGGFFNNKGLTLQDLCRFDEAKECYDKALEIMQKVEGGLADCAVTYVNLAHLFEKSMEDSENSVNASLEKAQKILDGDEIERNSYYAFVCSKCAPSFDYFGFFYYANELKERSKKIYEGA